MLLFPPQVSSEHQTTWLTRSTAQLRPQEEEVGGGEGVAAAPGAPNTLCCAFNGFPVFLEGRLTDDSFSN